MKSNVVFASCLFVLLAVLGGAWGQDAQQQIIMETAPEGHPHHMIAGREFGPGDPETFAFIASEFEFGGKPVKGAPYSGEAVTERTQNLSDGNRIVQKNNARVYRDGEGRTRREQELGAIGPWVASSDPQKCIFINDPVAGFHYMLDPRKQTAHKMKVPNELMKKEMKPIAHAGIKEEDVDDEIFEAPVPPPEAHGEVHREVFKFYSHPEDMKTEPLGKQKMEGVDVEGTRTIATIPAGKIGNELPIQIVSEKWYSPELQLVIMKRHTDPRFGETVYRLTNISRGEPDKSLFQVPAGYKVEEGPGPDHIFIKKKVD